MSPIAYCQGRYQHFVHCPGCKRRIHARTADALETLARSHFHNCNALKLTRTAPKAEEAQP